MKKSLAGHLHGDLLIHASTEARLDILQPFTGSSAGNYIYATCCPVFATFHVLRCKYGYPLFLYQYSVFAKKLVLFVARKELFETIQCSDVTLYFVEKDGFIKDARKVGLLEKASFGLIRNTNVEYKTDRAITPVSKSSLTLRDLVSKRSISVHKYTICAVLR